MMKFKFVERYRSAMGVWCYKWKCVAGEGVLRKFDGSPDICVGAGDEVAISIVSFWAGESRFVNLSFADRFING